MNNVTDAAASVNQDAPRTNNTSASDPSTTQTRAPVPTQLRYSDTVNQNTFTLPPGQTIAVPSAPHFAQIGNGPPRQMSLPTATLDPHAEAALSAHNQHLQRHLQSLNACLFH